jgi:hypothetical protein
VRDPDRRAALAQLVAAGVPRDTVLCDLAGYGWLTRAGDPVGYRTGFRITTPNAFSPSVYQASWVRVPGDTALWIASPHPLAGRGPLVHYEDLALANRCRICALYGYVSLRGIHDAGICDTSRTCP